MEEGTGILRGAGVLNCSFPGPVKDHPSTLHGEIAEIAGHSRALTSMPGVHGLDLIAYRHVCADPIALTQAVIAASAGPVIAAGSITWLGQIRARAEAGAWGFTIGATIFEGRVSGGLGIATQIQEVLAACGGLVASGRD